jgi:hypothetical protein
MLHHLLTQRAPPEPCAFLMPSAFPLLSRPARLLFKPYAKHPALCNVLSLPTLTRSASVCAAWRSRRLDSQSFVLSSSA